MLNIIHNELECNYSSYTKLFLGVPGIGKTSNFFRICDELYGRKSSVLLTLGYEPKPKHVRGASYAHLTSFEQIKMGVKDLCINRNTKYKNIREVGFDTIDELFRLAEDYVVREYNESCKDAKKKTNTISAAYGGFQKGENRVVDLITETCFILTAYGYGITFLGHSKYKMVKDQVTEIETDVLTCTLENKYYSAIKNKVNFVGMAYYEVQFDNVTTKKDVFSKEDKEVADKIVSKKPVIVFKDQGFVVDCKSHFGNIADKIDFNPTSIIDAIYGAIKEELALELGVDEVSQEQFEEIQREQLEETMEKANEVVEQAQQIEKEENDALNKDEIIDEVKSKMSTLTETKKGAIMEVLRNSGKSGLTELELEDLLKVQTIMRGE